ncbi:MAG: hypothetical protein V3T72_11565, partial [Thermoanaerobaculia bacterium]
GKAAADLQEDLSALGVTASGAHLDVRSGRWGTLMLAKPLMPGSGVGNSLSWEALKLAAPQDKAAFRQAAWNAFAGYLEGHNKELRIDTSELPKPGRVTVHGDGDLVQIRGPRVIDGVPVRDSYITAAISHGNLIVFGAHNWAEVRISTAPTLRLEDAMAKAQAFLEPESVSGYWRKPELIIVPMARNQGPEKVLVVGDGYYHRLAWVIRPSFADDRGSWEALVDAHSGEVLSFEDTNHYVASTREVKGGVYPETNDGFGPEGVEQAGWPMPFADVTVQSAGCNNNLICEAGNGENCTNCADCNGLQSGKPANRFCCGDGGGDNPVPCSDPRCTEGSFQCTEGGDVSGTLFTDAGGNLLTCVDGTITSTLSGQFMAMNDNCGAISLSSTGDIDFGTSGGIDCTTPGFGGAGNTHSSRSGFYEMNRYKEMARGQLPGNAWLSEQLTANMNINDTCNAFWNGSTVNFYRSGGGCNNTGEIAGVFVHEQGHGMDDNDADGVVNAPGEATADVYTFLRLNTSCIGRGFRLGTPCTGFGDACVVGSPSCDGVRDSDYTKHESGTPHTIANFVNDTWLEPVDGGCQNPPPPFSAGPCGGQVHCEGQLGAEAVWDLFDQDLPAAGHDFNTALEIATRLTFIGTGNIGDWFTCAGLGNDGCGANSAYMQYLTADDDNGNLLDGTPNGTAIFNAFNRHGIACAPDPGIDTSCVPTAAPTLTATALDRGASLSWTAVATATSYEVFRTDGVKGCNFGKIKVGETTATSFVDEGLQNGRDYFYTVLPIGSQDSCLGPASNCPTVTPVTGPNIPIDDGSAALTIGSVGDNDVFLDNCEEGTWSFDVNNIGTGAQTDVRIVAVTPSNGGITIDTTLPSIFAPSLAECATATGSFDFTAGGLTANETVTFQVDITSDELSPNVKSATFTVNFAESDFQGFSSKTYDFEVDEEGWQTIQGTFVRDNAGGGAQSTSWYESSSDNLADQCDHIRSPVIGLASTSTLSLWNQFGIEGFCGVCGSWYDRANVGIFDPDTGGRNPVDPDGGRTYNASGQNGTCGTTGQDGWAATSSSWGESTWSSSALGGGAIAGEPVQLDIRYGTDALAHGFGFHFDQVTLTDFEEQIADAQSDICQVCGDTMCILPENQCSCPQDCGTPPTNEIPNVTCFDTFDNDCDGDTDCDDSDCLGIDPNCPVCILPGQGQPCDANTLCCSGLGNCTGGKPANRVCL